MRRVGLIVVVLALVGTGAAIAGSRAEGSSSARFDVIFDDARGLIGGQLVKVAGARAGTIQNVTLTPQFKARVEATIDSRFVPFHQDATCTIRPEGLIAENYIDCDPGTADSPVLRSVARAAADRAGHTHDRAGQPARPVQHLQRTDPGALHAPRQRARDRHRRARAGHQRHPAPGQPDPGARPPGHRDPGSPEGAARDDRRRDERDRGRGRQPHRQPPAVPRQRGGADEHHRESQLEHQPLDPAAARAARRRPASAPATRHRGQGWDAACPAARGGGPGAQPRPARPRAVRGGRQAGPGVAVDDAQGGDQGASGCDAAGHDGPEVHAGLAPQHPAVRHARVEPPAAWVRRELPVGDVLHHRRARALRRDLAPALDPADRPQQRPLRVVCDEAGGWVQRPLWVTAGVQAGEGVR